MAGQIFVRQAVTGRIYIVDPRKESSKAFLDRKDIGIYDPDTAQARINAVKKKIEELDNRPKKVLAPSITDEAAELAALEAELAKKEQALLEESLAEQGYEKPQSEKTAEEIEKEEKEKIISEDPDINRIENMSTKQEVIDYVLEEFGTEMVMPSKAKLEDYKLKAFDMRINRLFETKVT
jgi:hypothetical protein